MCSIKIDSGTLNKLTHVSLEIRLRTLEQLTSKLNRALELNENIEFKPSELCKQLIRWFAYSPPQQSLKVLNLLQSVIESSKYGSQVINKLGSERLIKELRKIQTLFDNKSTEFHAINKLKVLIKNQLQLKGNQQEEMGLPDLSNLIDDFSNMKIEGLPRFCTEDYETPWSLPSPSDFASMKFLSDTLVNKFANKTEIENAVSHLQITMSDYPVEYLLQAPNIFQNLLQLYDERQSNEHKFSAIDIVASALLQFLSTLEKNLRMSRKSKSFKQSSQKNRNETNSQTPCQLRIEKALCELLDASIFHLELHVSNGNVSPVVWEVIFMILKVLENTKKSVDILCLYKVASIIANLSSKYAETEHCARLRLHEILLILLLQDIAEKNLCPNTAKVLDVFEPILRDYTIKCFFIKRYELTEAYVVKSESRLKEKYKLLKLYERSIEISTQMLKNLNWSDSNQIIKEGQLICKILDVLQSKELIEFLFGAIVRGIPLYRENYEAKTQAIELLIRLANITVMPLKITVYKNLADAFKRHIGCLMTGERYSLECSNDDLLKAQIIGIPLNTDLVKKIIYESFESTCNQIKINCCKIIELLLKSQNLFHTHWFSLLQLLFPLMPLLNCCTFSQEIMDSLVKLLDPDVKKLPFICVLQGNIGCLFHSNADRRSEALTRLIYTLNSLKGAENYMPNLLEISDTIPNILCYETVAREYKNIFSDRLPVRCEVISSLNNLLHLLESPDVEPLVRKTTLMQINVLCNNWNITAELCAVGAFYLILQALESALQKSSEMDYTDSVVPVIGILSKIMLYDSSFRCELAETPNIYVLILRALFMFHYDVQLRQDATLCLFLLLFSSYIVSTENSADGPLILRNTKMPINVNLGPALYSKDYQELENCSKIFTSSLQENQYWRMVMSSAYFGGLKNITQKSIQDFSKLDIREDLKLTSLDVRIIRATQPNVSLQRLLKAAVNATDHRSLIQACTLLKLQLIVPRFKNTFCIIDDFCEELNKIFRRYLHMPPGNKEDFDLYEHLLDLVKICLNIKMEPVALEISKSLHKDHRHALITMLTQAEEIPLRIYNKITTFLKILMTDYKAVIRNSFESSECSTFYNKLFDFFIERCLQLFEIRDLQRVRCLLSLIVALSSCRLNISDELLFFYCRRFVQLSLALKSFTQTGAQWHRDCLYVVLALSDQMQNSKENFRLTGSFVKYLSGLCGHTDVEVRTLAWSILNITGKTKAIESTELHRKITDISGTELLINELSYLPGGFLACCLSTLLDADETVSVRDLAGQLFSILIRTQGETKEIEKILHSHNFIRMANEALSMSTCVLEVELPEDFDESTGNIITTDLISCYSLICIELSQRSPAFLNELCTKSFMFKLYEILKQPAPLSKHIGYLNMIGHICRLYTLCYSDNLNFLQRTICRDAAWLTSFCEILFGTVAPSGNVFVTVNMLQLFLILLKDSTVLEQIYVKLQEHSDDIVILLQNALNISKVTTSFQSCSLSILSLLLVKSQLDIEPAISCSILKLFDVRNVSNKLQSSNEVFESDDKENNCGIKNQTTKGTVASIKYDKSTISEHVCIFLIRLFNHLYPLKCCKFSTSPNLSQQHVTETLALLLKQSPIAQETAQDIKFHEKVLKIFKNFFEEFATTSCTTYLKRNGTNKKLAVIKNLQLLFKLLLNWFSSPSITITDNMLAMEYCKIIINIWSWLAHSNDLKLTVLKVCAFLSERSLVVCKQFSIINNSSFQHSVLQLTAKMITAETLKVKANSTDLNVFISAGLRVLINCCSCLEGRNVLNKMHILDIFETLYPFNPKTSQSKKEIVIAWLEFWEIFSRYEEGAKSRHLNGLCSVVNKSLPGCSIRILSLRILRNMAFLNSNRSTLITSNDFMFTVNEIVSQPIGNSAEEKFIMGLSLWKLISGGIKFVAMIRGTKLAKNLRSLKENLACTIEETSETFPFANDLLNVLNIIFKIFDN